MTAAEATHRVKNARVFATDPDGWYVEPSDCTAALLTVERLEGRCWDPACGQGNIVRTLLDAGLEAIGTDKVRRVPADTPWFDGRLDFLNALGAAVDRRASANLVCNPPFGKGKLAEAFILKALGLANERNPRLTGKIAIYTELRFLTGLGRARGLYRKHTPNRVWILTPRPSCPPGRFLAEGGKAEGGTGDFCWLVWDLAEAPPEPGRWITGHAERPIERPTRKRKGGTP